MHLKQQVHIHKCSKVHQEHPWDIYGGNRGRKKEVENEEESTDIKQNTEQ